MQHGPGHFICSDSQLSVSVVFPKRAFLDRKTSEIGPSWRRVLINYVRHGPSQRNPITHTWEKIYNKQCISKAMTLNSATIVQFTHIPRPCRRQFHHSELRPFQSSTSCGCQQQRLRVQSGKMMRATTRKIESRSHGRPRLIVGQPPIDARISSGDTSN